MNEKIRCFFGSNGFFCIYADKGVLGVSRIVGERRKNYRKFGGLGINCLPLHTETYAAFHMSALMSAGFGRFISLFYIMRIVRGSPKIWLRRNSIV